MKTMKRVFSVALLVVLVLSLSVNAFAAKGPHTYKVRIFPGNNGTVSSGADCISGEGLDYGTRETARVADDGLSVTYNGVTISVSNEKYYIRGIREAGKDSEIRSANASMLVEQDTDYVVVYGMRGDAVSYTVRYLSQDGETPMSQVAPDSGVPESITGYGAAGDKPIVGYYPIDGYLPYAMNPAGELVQTFNITMTLSEDESANVFTFIYLPEGEEPEEPEEPGEEPEEPGEEPGEEPEQPAQEQPAEEQPAEEQPAEEQPAEDAAANDAAAADDAAAEPEVVEIGDEEVPLAEPEEILDMDVPLANAPSGIGGKGIPASWTEGPGAIFANHAVMAGIGGGVIVIAVALWLFLRSRKKDKENAK